jgi:hypothetical protein
MGLLFDSLVDRSIDPSGLQMDRAGMFGQSWVRLLEELGLETLESLAALAAVSKVLLSEKKGTMQVWLAFIEPLQAETPTQTLISNLDLRLTVRIYSV